MATGIKIKALKGIPLRIAADRELFKLMETLFIIKAMWVDCPMPATPQAKQELAAASGRSVRTIQRRLAALQERDLVRCYQLRGYECISWYALAERYGIKHIHFFIIELVPGIHLAEILKSKTIQEKLNSCNHAFSCKLRNNAYLAGAVKSVAGSAHNTAVALHQLNCFETEGVIYNEEERYALSTFYKKKDEKLLRGDLQVNYATLKRMFGYTGCGSIAWLKRKLRHLGLLLINKRERPIRGHSTRSSRITRLGFVKRNISDQGEYLGLTLIMPDELVILPLKGLQQRHETNKQATDGKKKAA